MSFRKHRRSFRAICSRGLLLLCVVISMTLIHGCQKKEEQKKESAKKTQSGWRRMKITSSEEKEEIAQVQKISRIYDAIGRKSISKKERKEIIRKMLSMDYSVADVGPKGKSRKNAPAIMPPSTLQNGELVLDFYKKMLKKQNTQVILIQMKSSGGFGLVHLKSDKGDTIAILTTVIPDHDQAKLQVSEMVKYRMKSIELTKDNILKCECYLSDQDELQADGLMEFKIEK